jgi:starch synthase
VWHGGVDIWTKGLDVLLAAWRQLKLEDGTGSWKLLIIGGASPEESANMKRMLQQPNTSGVTFVEQWILDRDLLRRYLSASDVYVFPSRSDAFGISALEGAACGCPLVISSGAGAAEIFPDQESSGAIVFENEDSVALAAALHKLLADPKLSAEVGRRARKTVEDCASMDRVGSELLDFLLRSHGKTARQSV